MISCKFKRNHDDFRDNLANYQRLTGQADEAGKVYATNSETSGRYHTDWLNMIYPRLRLARNLLREDGVIFISIDDNEQGNLKKICDEIFGEDNMICNFIWKSKLGKVGTASTISATHEYILCYAKNKDAVKFKMIETPNEGRKENLRQWGQADRREDRPSMYYPIRLTELKFTQLKKMEPMEDGESVRIKQTSCLQMVN
jgi:adenine-specific DNA-methyltransferase